MRDTRRDRDNEIRLNKAERHMAAAEGVFRGRMEEFFACLFVGEDEVRRQVREGVMAAHEALLDAHEARAWVMLEKEGIDPLRRHL